MGRNPRRTLQPAWPLATSVATSVAMILAALLTASCGADVSKEVRMADEVPIAPTCGSCQASPAARPVRNVVADDDDAERLQAGPVPGVAAIPADLRTATFGLG